MHNFIPTTDKEELEMLKEIGFNSFDELTSFIPPGFKNSGNIGLEEGVSELEIDKLLCSNTFYNTNNQNSICFMGGGVYDHFIPKVVDTLSSRSEFYTAYTPYQPEVSQGTLEYLYEFQSMICELSGMDVSNASLYDGASAVAEACSMSLSITKKNIIALSSTLNPNYINVIKTYLSKRNCEIILLDQVSSRTSLSNICLDSLAAIVIQSPNYYGLIEDWSEAKHNISNSDALLIAVSDPMILASIKSPGECGADIYAGEGQTLGNSMSFGGPYLGLLSTKKKYIRKVPGRIVAKTNDLDGRVGFTLTLQTREQHIRRENATSNICTNQSLLALRSTIYMSLAGKLGLSSLNQLCYNKSQYAYDRFTSIEGFEPVHDRAFIKEFCLKTKFSASKMILDAAKKNILIGVPSNDRSDTILQIAITEKRSKQDIETLYDFFSNYS
mgnify:CR=1 FL=1